MEKNDGGLNYGSRFLHNWSLKLLALVLAFIVWVVVVNINNPINTITISGIPVQINNDEMIKDEGNIYRIVGNQRASVRVTQRRAVLSSLSASDFTAVADFKDIYRKNQVPITVTCQNSAVTAANITLLTPSLEIETESIQSKVVNIEVLTIGEPAEGYTIGEITLSRSSVEVKAPESVIARLRSATISVDVSGASQSVSSGGELVLRDAYGDDMSLAGDFNPDEVFMSVSSVEATVEILNTGSINVTALIKDVSRVADGYRYTGYTVRPEKITVSGMKTALAGVTSIEIQDERLSVAGATSDVTVEVNVEEYLPDGVYLLEGDTGTVSVTMRIEALEQRTIQMPVKNITVRNVPEGLDYSFFSDSYTLTVKGLSADIDLLQNQTLEGTIDLSVYEEPGDYNVTVRVELPEGFEQIGPATAGIRLTQPATVPAQESSEEESESSSEADQDASLRVKESTLPLSGDDL